MTIGHAVRVEPLKKPAAGLNGRGDALIIDALQRDV